MKRLFLSLFLLMLISLSANSQTPYHRYYDFHKKHLSVEGMLNADSLCIGKWTWWYRSGKLYKQGSYDEQGRKTGLWKVYYEDGSRLAEECYSGNGYNRSWFENGNLQSEVEVVDGKQQGTYTSWYANGKKKEEAVYRDGQRQGRTQEWHENGQLKIREPYAEDKGIRGMP